VVLSWLRYGDHGVASLNRRHNTKTSSIYASGETLEQPQPFLKTIFSAAEVHYSRSGVHVSAYRNASRSSLPRYLYPVMVVDTPELERMTGVPVHSQTDVGTGRSRTYTSIRR